MDFVLRHHDSLWSESFDQRAHVGAHCRRGQQDRAVAYLAGALEGVAKVADELVQARRLQRELTIRALADQCEDGGDWRHGETLIRESYFETYAQELADDIGAIPKDARWPCTCIDWEQAARVLRMGYTEVDYDGVAYLMRA